MMAEKPTILILTTNTGGGHRNLAQSLTEILGSNFNFVIVNPQSEMSGRWYSFISRHWVRFLTWQYVFTDIWLIAYCFHRVLAWGMCPRLGRMIEEVQPRLIIATHSLLSHSVACAIKRSHKKIPLVFQLTDLKQVHETWFTEKRVDAYLVPSEEIFAQALARGIDRKRLHLTGRPVRRQFSEVSLQKRAETLASLGFDAEVFTIFLQGGAGGSARVHQSVVSLLKSGIPLQIILAVGNNTRLAELFQDLPQVRILPFTEQIAPYLAAADVIVGKAGASFITEAFMVERPFLVTAFFPGQETPNLRFIEQYRLGWIRLEPETQQNLLLLLARDTSVIEGKLEAIQTYKAWNQRANQAIRPLIENLLSQGQHASEMY
ncbi:MAG TPA: glycosyltransferase [Ktedonobacteraceae bacterium]|nr:glycosyltransferase [Ktedonobacteraceae bacterium]